MKPRIGRKVYCIYGDGILVDEVAFLGRESFIIASLSDDTESDSWEWHYEDYEKNGLLVLQKPKKSCATDGKKPLKMVLKLSRCLTHGIR